MVDQVLIDIKPYIHTEGEQLLGSLLAQVMIKSNLVADEHIELKNMMDLNLEKGLGILGDDELLEITPKALRIRKVCLTEGERRRNSREVTAN